ncbi:hypothetical protein Q4S45_08475 [Massilia sp. R2A-15]|uniref:hypothetical protein n=1 Tax=Massilia sp. R2A-15 TaxID=3064278 RepID=UPI002734D403|nr:hypothetical protein [Massilia sp. R2A-15]WLI91140.1 hypothetical protein Q4S45_08475 [Massilia sp. R2A-15]
MNTLEKDYVVSYLTLRQMIGWAGLLMPLVVRGGGLLFEDIASNESISAYYYTDMRDIFVSTLVLVGALLACYRTPQLRDNLASTAAGIAAIGIGLFPMNPSYAAELIAQHPHLTSADCYSIHGVLGYHFIFVATFFALSFYLVYFRFAANTPVHPGRNKLMRNRIYKLCGLVMLLAFAAIGWIALVARGASIFWPESGAVGAFAIAWLVKGQTVLKDTHSPQVAAPM